MGLARLLHYFRCFFWQRQAIFLHSSAILESGVTIACHNAGEIHIGSATVLKEQVKMVCNGGHISIGDRVQIGYFSVIASHGSIEIGHNTLIAEHVSIRGSQHNYNQGCTPKAAQGYVVKPVVIGENVWIGAKVVILPGVVVGDHTVIGAGAVVTHSIPAGKVAAGVPAKVIGDVPSL